MEVRCAQSQVQAPHMRSQSLVLHRSQQAQVPCGRSLELVLHRKQVLESRSRSLMLVLHRMKTVLVPRTQSHILGQSRGA